MEQPFSTSKVTVEYHDPHGLYRLLAPGLLARLPLKHLHWQSHSGPLRSIDTLHVELVSAESNPPVAGVPPTQKQPAAGGSADTPADDGFQTATVSGRQGSLESTTTTTSATPSSSTPRPPERRHQIPGLRRTPYLKLLLVRCDDTDTYKSQTRSEIKEWVKKNASSSSSSSSSNRKASIAPVENHDAFEWMIVHVVLPNSPAYSQPRTSKSSSSDGTGSDTTKTTSRWGKNSSTLLERLRSDFNTTGDSKSSSSNSNSSSGAIDRVSQIRVGVNDVPYELLPRVQSTGSGTTPPAGGYVESEREAQAAWADVVDKLKSRILASFDVRVSQYEDDIREKDVQRTLPGWNFCTFFILKEGLARGFESVGLVDDALVGYDELSVGLDTVIQEQHALTASTLLSFTDDLKKAALKAIHGDGEDADEPVNLQAATGSSSDAKTPAIPISATKKPYRDLILANNVSVFDFRCYIFARQIALLLRLGNAWATREELLTKLQEQQESTMHLTPAAAASHAASSSSSRAGDDPENLSMLAEICRRTLEFVPAVSQVMREDLLFALSTDGEPLPPSSLQIIDNMVASFAFSIAQQILAQTSTRALPIPPSTMTLASDNAQEPKVSIPEPKTMMHPARTSSLETRGLQAGAGAGRGGRPPLSPGIFPGPGQPQSGSHDAESTRFLKAGLEDLAARRADLYMLSRNILQKGGEKRGWSDGWSTAPVLSEAVDDDDGLEEVSLDDDKPRPSSPASSTSSSSSTSASAQPIAGIDDLLLRTALETNTGFFRLYEILTEKARHHYTVAGHASAVNANLADLAVLKYHLADYAAAASYFYEATLFFGENSWGRLELSLLLMYARSNKEMGRNGEYAWLLLKFLTKAAEAERQRLEERASFGRKELLSEKADEDKKQPPASAVQGCLSELLSASTSVTGEMRVPLTSFFRLVAVDGPPVFADGEDSFYVTLRLESLLLDTLPVDSVKVRLTQTSSRGQAREIWLETKEATTIATGTDRVQLHSRTIIPGIYAIDQVRIASKNLVIVHERDGSHTVQRLSTAAAAASAAAAVTPTSPTSPAHTKNILAEPHLVLYQRTDALDVQLSTSKDLQLDKNNFLELALLTGWNDIQHCEMRIRAATGGLRLITTEAKVLGTTGHKFAKPVEGGIVSFNDVPPNTSLAISFPFSIEQDVLELCLKVDVTYTTRSGATFHFSKAPSVSTALALGVNVQDVFKHDALFSRFTVSTATASPLRVFRSELLESDLFTAQLGTDASEDGSVDHSTNLPVVFPKQPVSLLYKIVRRPIPEPLNAPPSKDAKRTMYIKLHYSVLQDQLDATLEASLAAAFKKTAALAQFAKLASSCVLRHVHASLSPYDLEKIALLNEMSTSVLAHVNWAREFPGLGPSASGDASKTKADDLAAVIYEWQKQHAILAVPPTDPAAASTNVRTILIPVDIPSITIVHTADIQLQGPFGAAVSADRFEGDDDSDDDDSDFDDSVSMPIFTVNQLLPATLHLRWTRVWDTGDADVSSLDASSPASSLRDDLEFSFEVSAPTDAWLIGGRRKGHFVIPAPDADGSTIGLSSTPALEAEIPLMLIPLREGRLPYPSVEIRQVMSDSGAHADASVNGHPQDAPAGNHHCETDYRNLGETVHVVADRTRLTLSLDASGPGGGPLVLESERAQVVGRVVV